MYKWRSHQESSISLGNRLLTLLYEPDVWIDAPCNQRLSAGLGRLARPCMTSFMFTSPWDHLLCWLASSPMPSLASSRHISTVTFRNPTAVLSAARFLTVSLPAHLLPAKMAVQFLQTRSKAQQPGSWDIFSSKTSSLKVAGACLSSKSSCLSLLNLA